MGILANKVFKAWHKYHDKQKVRDEVDYLTLTFKEKDIVDSYLESKP